jgi:hypothetical protein
MSTSDQVVAQRLYRYRTIFVDSRRANGVTESSVRMKRSESAASLEAAAFIGRTAVTGKRVTMS